MLDVNFNPQNPIKLLPGATSSVTFEQRFIPDKANEPYFAHVSVRLVNALPDWAFEDHRVVQTGDDEVLGRLSTNP